MLIIEIACGLVLGFIVLNLFQESWFWKYLGFALLGVVGVFCIIFAPAQALGVAFIALAYFLVIIAQEFIAMYKHIRYLMTKRKLR